MGAFGGTSINRQGLVFGFDIGNPIVNTGISTRFYKGEPTTNLANFNISSSAFSSDTPGNLTQTANSSEATFEGRLSRKMSVGAGFWNAYIYNYNTGTSSTNFSVSYKVKTSDGSHPNTIITGGYIYGSAGNFFPAPTFTYLYDNWYLATLIYSGTSMTLNSITGMYGTGGPKTFYITDYQAEAKTKSTPFVTGTRSATNSLIDLKKSSSMDVSNISFDSNGLPTFDGTNDYINIASSTVFDTQAVTVEVVVKPNGLNQYGFWFEKGLVNTQYSLFMESTNIVWRQASGSQYNSQYTATSTMTNNAWNHVVGTFKTGERITYVNGTARTSDSLSYTLNTNQGNQFIGSYNSGAYYYNGQIAVVKVYNRALSATEVASNFKAYQKRFNIQ
jgi:hypothetical protein